MFCIWVWIKRRKLSWFVLRVVLSVKERSLLREVDLSFEEREK
jgi:hypothetical protein